MTLVLGLIAGTLPVGLFLLALTALDGYKLMSRRRILLTMGWGGAVALACYGINTVLFARVPYYAWAGAPVVEEVLKAAVVVQAIRRERVGFLVDAAICGFATGAGFAFVENLTYAQMLHDGVLVFVLRGFGTAVMHGGTTALVGIMARRARDPLRGVWQGLALAIVIHGAYNLGLLPPAVAAAVLLVSLPVLLALVFAHSEAGLRRWLGEGFDSEVELLEMVTSGQFLESRTGAYLKSLKAHFAPEVLADMFCLIQISLELSVRAKGELLKREAGFPTTADPAVAEKLRELAWLKKSVGPSGRMALAPLIGGRRHTWQVHMLDEQSGQRRGAGHRLLWPAGRQTARNDRLPHDPAASARHVL